jgi:hypothetical protein
VHQSRVFLFGVALIYLVGVVVQFFLAGLGAFSATTYDTHKAFGYVLGILSIGTFVLAIVGKVPRDLVSLAAVLLGLNVVQIIVVHVDVDEIAALHVVNALAIAGVAFALVRRSRRYLTTKVAAGETG